MTKGAYRAAVQSCRGRIRKAKANLALNLARDASGNKKDFYKYINSERKPKYCQHDCNITVSNCTNCNCIPT